MHLCDIFNLTSAPLVKSSHCYEGLGLYYRGTVSQSQSGRTCVEWDPQIREQYMTSDINSGEHNYCRWAVTIKSNNIQSLFGLQCIASKIL